MTIGILSASVQGSLSGRLFAEERHYFESGYGPRSIQFSRDASDLIVGFKDGTIRVVQNLRKPAAEWKPQSLIPREERPGARSLVVLSDNRLLVGRDGGALDVITDWTDETRVAWRECTGPATECDNPGGVTLVAEPVAGTVLVSYRFAGTWIKPLAALDNPTVEWTRLADPTGSSPGEGLLCIAPVFGASSTMLAASDRGEVFRTELRTSLMEKLDGPPGIGFVSDIALVKPTWKPADWGDGSTPATALHAHGIYLATDSGLYLVWFKRKDGKVPGSGALNWSRIALPGVGAMVRAVSYFADDGDNPEPDPRSEPDAVLDGGKRFLWVADSGGDAYMFTTPGTTHDDVMENGALSDNCHFWQSCGIRHQGTQVMRAFMSPTRPDLGRGRRPLLVGQASRNAPIVVSLYQPVERQGRR